MTRPPSLSGSYSVNDVVSRDGGSDVLQLLRRAGFWSESANPLRPDERRAFPTQLHALSSDELGDQNAYWQSELSRVTEALGVLDAERYRRQIEVRRARSHSAEQILNNLPEGEKRPTKAELDVRVDLQPEVVEAENDLASVEITYRALQAIRESYEGVCRVLSREITRRGDELRAGVR